MHVLIIRGGQFQSARIRSFIYLLLPAPTARWRVLTVFFGSISAMPSAFSELHNLRILPNTDKTVFLFV